MLERQHGLESKRCSPRYSDIERATTFIIKINPDGSRQAIEKNPVSKIVGIGHRSGNESESFEWSDLTGRVIVRAWPGNLPREMRHGLHIIAGWPVCIEGRLVGHYATAEIDSSGRGVVRQDPYGLHPLYIGSALGITLVSNRPHLIAAEIERLTDNSAVRDYRFAAWLAFSGYPIGDRTGYEDVQCIPFGATVRIDPDHGVKFSSKSTPWRLSATDLDDSCIDRIESELIANLRAAVSAMDHKPRLQLTGGRDSRLILALTVRAGLLQDVEIVTLGSADLPDATVAKELTTRLGIDHTVSNWNDGVVVRRQLCPHVGRVAGAVGCIDSSISLSVDGRMTMSGLVGETLRTNWQNKAGYRDLRSIVVEYMSGPFGKAGILQRDAYTAALTDGIRSILEPSEQMARSEDLFDSYYIQHRVRRWLATRPERFADEFFPLYYPPATELAFQMDWRDRVAGRIHNTIIERAGRLISEPPYYKPGGFYKPPTTYLPLRKGRHKRISRYLYDTAHGFLRRLDKRNFNKLILKQVEDAFNNIKRPSAITGTGATNPSLTRRQAAYRELITARDDNPVFGIVNRDCLIDAVNRLPTLNSSAALQVHGAMSGVIWLGRLEEEY